MQVKLLLRSTPRCCYRSGDVSLSKHFATSAPRIHDAPRLVSSLHNVVFHYSPRGDCLRERDPGNIAPVLRGPLFCRKLDSRKPEYHSLSARSCSLFTERDRDSHSAPPDDRQHVVGHTMLACFRKTSPGVSAGRGPGRQDGNQMQALSAATRAATASSPMQCW